MDYRALVQKLGDRTNQNSQTSELILEHRTGHPILLTNPSKSSQSFATILNEFEGNRDLLKQMSENCKQRQIELSWEEKAKTMVGWYEKIVQHS